MDMLALEWIVAALAEELAAGRSGPPELVVARLRARLGHACADDELDPRHPALNARAALVDRIAARIEARSRARSGARPGARAA